MAWKKTRSDQVALSIEGLRRMTNEMAGSLGETVVACASANSTHWTARLCDSVRHFVRISGGWNS